MRQRASRHHTGCITKSGRLQLRKRENCKRTARGRQENCLYLGPPLFLAGSLRGRARVSFGGTAPRLGSCPRGEGSVCGSRSPNHQEPSLAGSPRRIWMRVAARFSLAVPLAVLLQFSLFNSVAEPRPGDVSRHRHRAARQPKEVLRVLSLPSAISASAVPGNKPSQAMTSDFPPLTRRHCQACGLPRPWPHLPEGRASTPASRSPHGGGGRASR